MLNIMEKKVYPEKSELLYSAVFTKKQFEDDFIVATGKWSVKDNWLTGYIKEDGGGLIYSKEHYYGDILMDFYARTIPPCNNDLNFCFCAKGWDFEKNDADVSYIGGLQGWWTGKTGIEKYPKMDLQAMTSLHKFVPGQMYHIEAGRIDNFCFIYIDGVLAVEMKDNNPIKEFGKIGFGCYASHVQFKDFKLYKPYSIDFKTSYAKIKANTKILLG